MPKAVKNRWIRPAVQWFFFIFVALVSYNHYLAEQGKDIAFFSSASLHAICPFGGVVGIYQYVTTGTLLQKTHPSSYLLMYIAVGLTLLVGPAICGWVCPLGTLEEAVGKMGRRLLGKRYNNIVPASLDRLLRYARYVVLVMVVYKTATTAKLMFADIDPYFALFNFWSAEFEIGGLIVLIVTLLLSLVVERPFCKYMCPFGALSGVFNFVRPFAIRRNATTCIDCKSCDRACPMNITVSTAGAVRDHQCISCMRCSSEDACPVADTVNLALKGAGDA